MSKHDGTDAFENALGRSLPDPHPQLDYPATIVGVEVYDGHIYVRATTFVNFREHTIGPDTRQAAAFSQVVGSDPVAGHPLPYDLVYPAALTSTDWPTRLRLKLRLGEAGKRIVLSLPLATAPVAGEIKVDGIDAVDAGALGLLTPGGWFYDSGTQTLWLMLEINPGPEPAPLDNTETLVRVR